ncbi:hypothetical protein [Microlunatus flavus]|uniref:hypothetical protein n=1 Tax=Microlunatus flavus TaxID=1036181 RepID=UPI000B8535D1|nr:hypothetical protein [Microlunatus flavus]
MDERPPTDWEARVAKAKREGTWYGPDEEPSPYPPRVRLVRFLVGTGVGLALAVVLGSVVHLVTGRPGSPFTVDALLHSLVSSVFLALWVGWSWTRPPRPRRPSDGRPRWWRRIRDSNS